MNERPFNQETDDTWNREPGIAIVPGSNYQREMAKHEQFGDSKWAFGRPGNPYTYRPFPKMLFRAERYNGKIACMAAPPDPYEFPNDREYRRADAQAEAFTKRCQREVKDEVEMQKAMESGWREDPAEAVKALEARERFQSEAAAHLNYEDRNLSEPAKREAAAVRAEADEHVAEIPEQKRRRKSA